VIAVETIQSLYDENRFLEAFRLTADFWKSGTDLERFSSDELILGAISPSSSPWRERNSRTPSPSWAWMKRRERS
jgi:hypothetical protein